MTFQIGYTIASNANDTGLFQFVDFVIKLLGIDWKSVEHKAYKTFGPVNASGSVLGALFKGEINMTAWLAAISEDRQQFLTYSNPFAFDEFSFCHWPQQFDSIFASPWYFITGFSIILFILFIILLFGSQLSKKFVKFTAIVIAWISWVYQQNITALMIAQSPTPPAFNTLDDLARLLALKKFRLVLDADDIRMEIINQSKSSCRNSKLAHVFKQCVT